MKTESGEAGILDSERNASQWCCGEGEGHTVMQLLHRFGDEEKCSFCSSKG